MAFKFLAFVAIASTAHAGALPAVFPTHTIAKVASFSPAPSIAKYPVPKIVIAEEYDRHPQYKFAYEVHDGLTGDSKGQQEVRDGDVVQGSYSLIDPDGFKRTVEYTSDPHNGFNAVVHREPLAQKAVAYASPFTKIAAPLTYAAPTPQYYHR